MDSETREAIREAVIEVLREQAHHPPFHRRAPIARQTDPNGKTWLSVTASKAQAVLILISLMGSLFGGMWASMAVRDELVVYPRVTAMVEGVMRAHKDDVRAEMSALRPTIATRVELDALAKELAVSRAERIEQYTAIQAQLDRIERRLERNGR